MAEYITDGSLSEELLPVNASSNKDTALELRAIRAALADIQNGKVAKIAVLGDSITRQATWMQLSHDLAYIYNKYPMPPTAGRRSVQTDAGGSVNDRLWNTRAGTWLHSTTGAIPPGGARMASGDRAVHRTWCDRVYIRCMSTTTPGQSAEIFIDGQKVADIAPLSYAGLQLASQWTSDQLTWDEHTVEIVAGANGIDIDVTYFYAGNYNQGVQVWDLGWSGGRTINLLQNNSDPALGSVVQSTLQWLHDGFGLGALNPDAIIMAFGTNDAGQTEDPVKLQNYDTDSRALISWIRTNLPNTSIIMWVPPAATGRTFWKNVQDVAQKIREDTGVVMIDSFEQLGFAADAGLNLVPDGTHPGPRSQPLISELATSRLFTRRTPIFEKEKTQVWENFTKNDDIDMLVPYSKFTITDDWSPDVIRAATSLDGRVRKTRILVQAALDSLNITFPPEITWTDTFPTLESGDWAMAELTKIPDAGILGEVIGTGTYTPDPPYEVVDWIGLYKAEDLSSVGDGNVVTVDWLDASGNGRNLNLRYGSPVYRGSYANLGGQPAVSFASDSAIRHTDISPAIPSGYSVIVIASYTSLATGTQRLFNHVSGGGRGIGLTPVGLHTWQGGADAATRITEPTPTATANVPVMYEIFAQPAASGNSRMAVNGVELITGAIDSHAINQICIGGVWSGTSGGTPVNLFHGAISVVGIFSGDHATNSDWQALRGPLAAKHGITLP